MSDTDLENPGLRSLLRPNRGAVDRAGPAEASLWMSLLPRVADSKFGFVAGVQGFLQEETDLETILDGWATTELNILLEGDMHRRGLVQLDPDLVAGLTEAQTLGKITSADVPERATTELDATLCDHVIEAFMHRIAQEQAKPAPDWALGRFVPDARSAKVLLSDGEYAVTRVRILLGEAARVGELRLLLPMPASARASVTPAPGDGRDALLDVETSLTAVLYTTKVPYTWLRDLKPDDLLEVPRAAIHRVRIEADGKRVAFGHLGRSGEHRAVRILDNNDIAAPRPAPVMGEGVIGGFDAPDLEESGGSPDLGDGGLDLPVEETMAEPLSIGGDLPDLPPLE